eukprot:15444915-Alexandrium_andersonii.AAC.1
MCASQRLAGTLFRSPRIGKCVKHYCYSCSGFRCPPRKRGREVSHQPRKKRARADQCRTEPFGCGQAALGLRGSQGCVPR